jgi:L-ornithine N5-oxygenase
MNHVLYDVLGIGFGPGNVALAIALQEQFPDIRPHFLEADSASRWQHNMMIANADIQHSPIMDLVTPRNPRSKYSYINYLHESERLFEYFNLGLEFPLRREYAEYVLWASEFFSDQVDYNCRASSVAIKYTPQSDAGVYHVHTDCGRHYMARTLVLATGRTPHVPEQFQSIPHDKIIHLSEYLTRINRQAPEARDVAVIGASQSAIEIILDLTERFKHLKVTNYIRHFAYRQKDLSPQMEASIYPKCVAEHYNRSWEQRRRFNEDLKYQNYSSADMDVLKELNLRDYMHRLSEGKELYRVINNSVIKSVGYRDDLDKVNVVSEDLYKEGIHSDSFDLVVLATGFKNMGIAPQDEKVPPLLRDLAPHFEFDEFGVLRVAFDYGVVPTPQGCPPVYLNGLCEGTHGVGDAGSFSLLALRSNKIAQALAKRLSSRASAKAGELVAFRSRN